MTEPVETVIIRGQQTFELNDTLNPVVVEINDHRILNVLNNIKMFIISLCLLPYYFHHQ